MATGGPRKFTGTAQDFIDWFRGIELAPVILPDSQTNGEGLPAQEDKELHLPPLPDYMRHEQGQSYAQKYQEEFANETQVSIIVANVFMYGKLTLLSCVYTILCIFLTSQKSCVN
nr:uncharacterized protein LOC128703037 [Cherax quadricarinatus]